MDVAFLAAINPGIPTRDVEAAIWIALAWICAAHLVVVPRLFASAPRHAAALLGLSIAGLGMASVFVSNRPALCFPTLLAYCAGFAMLCLLMARTATVATRRAAVLAAFGLVLLAPLFYLLAFTAR